VEDEVRVELFALKEILKFIYRFLYFCV